MSLLLSFDKSKIEAGCDEAGRGCLAGPVVAAAVILPANFKNTTLNDSKKLLFYIFKLENSYSRSKI